MPLTNESIFRVIKLVLSSMRYIFTFLLLAFGWSASAADTTKVLFIGNSFVASNDLPGIFQQLANQGGHDVLVGSHAPGGIFVGDTRQGNAAHAYNPATYDLLRSEKWDYVVVQDNQGFYSYAVGVFPPYSKVVEGHSEIRDSMLVNNPCSKMLLFSGWCFKNGWPGEFPDGASMNQRVYENYVYINKSVNQIVCPISISWNRIIKALPNIDLWSADEAHPSYEGSYLAAATIYSSIFKESAEQVQFQGPIPPIEAQLMRKTAYEAVVDSAEPTNLDTLPVAQPNRYLVPQTTCTNYDWYKDGVLVRSSPIPLMGPLPDDECYVVVGTLPNGCKIRSFKRCVKYDPGGGGGTSVATVARKQDLSIFPNPNTGSFGIRLAYPSPSVKVEVYSYTGSLVYARNYDASQEQYEVHLSDVAPGMYLVKLQTPEGTFTPKVQVTQ